MTSLFRCCAGGKRSKRAKPTITAPVSTTLSKQPNGQRINDAVLFDVGPTSVQDDPHQGAFPIAKRALPLTPKDDKSSPTCQQPFFEHLQISPARQSKTSDESEKFGQFAAGIMSSEPRFPSTGLGLSYEAFSMDDYDNPVGVDDDEVNVVGSNRPSLKTFSRSSAGSGGATSGNCNEQSLDHIVAHLLASVSDADENDNPRKQPADIMKQSTSHQQQQQLQQLAIHCTSDVDFHDYDVPKGTNVLDESGKLPGVNDDYDVPRSPVAVEDISQQVLPSDRVEAKPDKTVAEPPLLVIHKKESTQKSSHKATLQSDTAVNSCDGKEVEKVESDQVLSQSQPFEIVSKDITKNNNSNDSVYSVPQSYQTSGNTETETSPQHNFILPTAERNLENVSEIVPAQNPSGGNNLSASTESQSAETLILPPNTTDQSTPSPRGSYDFDPLKTPESLSLRSSRDSRDLLQQPLIDQFKALRLEVLKSTSQLLSCVGGTWKRGDSPQSKLDSVKPLCLALTASLNRFENFVQWLTVKSAETDHWQLHESMTTQISALKEVQAGMNVYIDSLDAASVDLAQPEVKLGTIVHLTKEIPILVRTFVPLIELVAQYEEKSNSSVPPQQDAEMSSNVEGNEQSSAHNDMQQVKVIPEVPPIVAEAEPVDSLTFQVMNPADEEVKVEEPSNPENVNEETNDASRHRSKTLVCEQQQAEAADNGRTIDTAAAVQQVLEAATKEEEDKPPPTPPPKQRSGAAYRASVGLGDNIDMLQMQHSPRSPEQEAAKVSDEKQFSTNIPHSTEPFHSAGGFVNGLHSVNGPATNNRSITLDDIASVDTKPFPPAALNEQNYSNNATSNSYTNYYQPVVLRRSTADRVPLAADDEAERFRISRSELQTPDIRASGISQTMVDQLEELQREANEQNVRVHTDMSAEYDNFDIAETTSFLHHTSRLCEDDRRLLVFYCDQMSCNWNVLDNAASAFFNCMDRRQPPKAFVMHSKFVILAGHKMAYIGDILAKNLLDDNARDWVVAYSNRLCNSLKTAVRTTKEAALSFPAVPPQQSMVDSVKEVTDWAIELKEIVDRLTYLGRPDHVLA